MELAQSGGAQVTGNILFLNLESKDQLRALLIDLKTQTFAFCSSSSLVWLMKHLDLLEAENNSALYGKPLTYPKHGVSDCLLPTTHCDSSEWRLCLRKSGLM